MYQANANHEALPLISLQHHLNEIQPDDRRRTFLRNVKLIYFPTQYNDAEDYHSSNGQRDSSRACGLQMVLVMERQYVYFAAEATFLCVTELDVMVEGNNVDYCTVLSKTGPPRKLPVKRAGKTIGVRSCTCRIHIRSYSVTATLTCLFGHGTRFRRKDGFSVHRFTIIGSTGSQEGHLTSR